MGSKIEKNKRAFWQFVKPKDFLEKPSFRKFTWKNSFRTPNSIKHLVRGVQNHPQKLLHVSLTLPKTQNPLSEGFVFLQMNIAEFNKTTQNFAGIAVCKLKNSIWKQLSVTLTIRKIQKTVWNCIASENSRRMVDLYIRA